MAHRLGLNVSIRIAAWVCEWKRTKPPMPWKSWGHGASVSKFWGQSGYLLECPGICLYVAYRLHYCCEVRSYLDGDFQ
jgi:hypothetical protein